MKIIFFVLYFLLGFLVYPDYPIIQSTKSSGISKVLCKDNSIFVLYNDNTLSIIDSKTGLIKNSISILAKEIIYFDVNPSRDEFFVVTYNKSYILKVFSYGNITKEIDLKSRPFFASYSKNGKYILYSNANSNGLGILDSQNLKDYQYLKTKSIVYFSTSNSKENILMYYMPTNGYVRYFNIDKKDHILSVKLIQNIVDMKILNIKNKVTIALKDNMIYVFNNIDGTLYDSLKISNLYKFEVSPKDEIAVLSKKNGKINSALKGISHVSSSIIELYTLDNNFKLVKKSSQKYNQNVTDIFYNKNKLLIGTSFGNLFYFEDSKNIMDNILNPIYSFAVLKNSLIYTNKDGLWKIDYNLDAKNKKIQDINIIPLSKDYKNYNIKKIDENTMVLYKGLNIFLFDLKAKKQIKKIKNEAYLNSLQTEASEIYFSNIKNAYIYNLKEDKLQEYNFENVYNIFKLKNDVILSLSKKNFFNTPLIRISKDGETVGINQFKGKKIVKVFKDHKRNFTYIISKRDRGTYLQKISDDFSTIQIDSLIDNSKGFVDFISDQDTDFFYFCDITKVKKFNGYYFLYKKNRKIPKRILLDKNFFYILYTDGSIEFLSKWTMDSLFEFDLIEDGFVILKPNNSFFSSKPKINDFINNGNYVNYPINF